MKQSFAGFSDARPVTASAPGRSVVALVMTGLCTLPLASTAWAQARADRAGTEAEMAESDAIPPSADRRADLDRPAAVTDCNRNGIEDRLDLAGVLPRGPEPTGRRPVSVTAADLNGDHRTDLVVANEADGTVTVLWQRSHRRFEVGPSVAVGSNPSCVATGDLDADGDPDIVVGHALGTTQSVTVLWNDGPEDYRREDLTLSTDPALARAPRCVTVADLDGDGDLDIVATSGETLASRKVTWFENTGGGRFATAVHKSVPANTPSGLAVADLDGDGRADIAVTSGVGDRRIVVVYNPGAGTGFADWSHNSYLDIGNGPLAVQAADLDGDGDLDLATANYNSSDVSVLLNDAGAGRLHRFSTASRHAVGAQPPSLAVADLDDDRDLDIVVPISTADRIAILWNQGAGTFAPATTLPVGDGPMGVWAGNLDTDRFAEIAVTHAVANTVWVLHLGTNPPAKDCNRNRIPDSCDIAAGTSRDRNHDDVPDECVRRMGTVRQPPR